MDKAHDLVISYCVAYNRVLEETHKPLQDALDNGYRVIDITSTPIPVGGAGSGISGAIVTVLLTDTRRTQSEYWRAKAAKRSPAGAIGSR